uniref:Uncharacterized protein n=1 Tax=Vespula pensylvanica TaxID=30213 RepID=A0A834NQ52_VESPE|nr:hypothetical protein H0235_011902 [Vespula pensylvanica]
MLRFDTLQISRARIVRAQIPCLQCKIQPKNHFPLYNLFFMLFNQINNSNNNSNNNDNNNNNNNNSNNNNK